MATHLLDIIREIRAERDYAQAKWPSAEPVSDTHYFAEWMSYGRQYLDEAFSALAHDAGHATARAKVLKATQLLLHALQCDDSQRTAHLTQIMPLPLPGEST